jgi:poly(3-hydroxybutyrate) depolymerase
MKQMPRPVWAAIILTMVVPGAFAQQIPFLSELISRNETFYRAYNQKKRAGADLSKLEPLRIKGETAFKRGDLPAVLEVLAEGSSALEGKAWNERSRFISSLTLEISASVVEPNQELQVALVRMFNTDEAKAFQSAPAVTIEIRSAGEATGESAAAASQSKPIVVTSHLPIGQSSTIGGRRLKLPDGAYSVVAIIENEGQPLAEIRRPLYAIDGFTDQMKAFYASVQGIKSYALTGKAVPASVTEAVTTPEFQLQRLASLSQRSDDGINPLLELARLETLLSALRGGQDHFADQRGLLERAYKSADGQLVPYRIYVPKAYDASRAWPLLIALHGALGDEQSYFSPLYDPEVIMGEAERRGYILATPNARTRIGGYGGPAEEDVLQVIKSVTRAYNIDPARRFLTGHSMGAYGAWLIASNHPELFAAIAPVSGGAPVPPEALPALLAKLKTVPVLVVHGAKDGIVPPEQSRGMVAQGQKAGLTVQYIEVPDADHLTVVGPTFPAILDFFDKQRKASQPAK